MNDVFTQLTPLRFLQRSAEVFPDKVAVVDGARRMTYRQLAGYTTRMARALQSSGVQPGDKVAFLAGNSLELIAAHFAVPLAGAVLVALNTRLSVPELLGIAEHSESKLLFGDAALLQPVAQAADHPATLAELVSLPTPDGDDEPVAGATDWSAFLGRGSDQPLPWTVQDEYAVITINYTSGTTGKPKGVMYTHRGAYLNSLGQDLHQGLRPDSVYLWTLPMFHCNGWCTAWAVTAVGARHICLRAVRGDDVWNAIAAEGVTHLCGAPTVLQIMSESTLAKPVQEALTITTAGAPPGPTIIGTFLDLGVTVTHVYGLTETYGPLTLCEYQEAWNGTERTELARLMSRQGVGMITSESIRVVEFGGTTEELQDVPADGATMGEIVMRGNTVMLGYYKDEQATSEAFAGGWFHSGDLGVMHPDGYVQLLDRAKDVIVSGGENISTIEVEQAIQSHPDVRDVAVVGIPHERWGEVPKAFVVLAAGSSATGEDIITHVQSRIARYKAPKVVEVMEDLPKTPTGKIRKNQLRDAEWGGRAERIQG